MLKSLELFGFKSFAEKTRFDFSPGITAVVGPNGSGKSNVVDGIKWILGDQSAKSLRGKEMTDVIFNGSSGRKGSNFAEATLTFDNTSGFLPIDAREVAIGRRLWRNGDAEYLINRQTARLKDIRSLLMGTGAGSAAYNIIEQGRVDQILQANAANRRVIFEEAAGISKFKARKADALRKLERVDQNLLRLRDIVEEVENRLNSLRTQAGRAAKYRDTSAELKKLWLGLAADDYRYQSEELTHLETELSECGRRLDEVNSRHQELESQLSALDVDIAEVEDRLRVEEQASSAQRETLAGHETTIGHQSSRLEELETELDRLRHQRTFLASRAAEVIGEIDHVHSQLMQFEQEHAERKGRLEQCLAEIAELNHKIQSERDTVEEYREQLLEQMKEASVAASRADGFRQQLKAMSESKVGVLARRSRVAEAVNACEDECRGRRDELETSGERVVRLGDRVHELHAERRKLLEDRHSYQQSLSDLREQRSGWQARKNVLDDLERRQNGLGVGVKELLRRAATLDQPPWNTIHGSVAELLEVELEHAAILEAALGPRSQYLVVDNLDSLVDYLTSGVCDITGRVGFVDLSALTPESLVEVAEDETGQTVAAATRDLSGEPGVCYRADSLVSESPRIADLPLRLLADTWVVETVQVARQLANGAGHGCRFVTLQGELLDADRNLVVGTLQIETALIPRKSELQRLKYDLQEVSELIEQRENELSGMAHTLTSYDDELDDIDHTLQEAADEHNQCKAVYHAETQELARLLRDLNALDEEVHKITLDEERVTAELQQAEAAHAAAEEQLEGLQNNISQLEFDLARSEHRLQTLEKTKTEERLSTVKHEERLAGMQQAYKRLEEDRTTRLQQRDEVERRYAAAMAKRQDITLHVLNTSAQLAELALEQESVGTRVRQLMAEKSDLRGRRSVFLKEETTLRSERRDLNDQQHLQEMSARDIRQRLESMAERIREEYQLELHEIVASDASAYHDYLNENHPGWQQAGDDSVDTDESIDESVELESGEEFDEPEEAPPVAEEPIPEFEELRDGFEQQVDKLRRRLKSMGNVDTESLGDLEEMEARFAHMSTQLADLTEAKAALEEIVRKINTESKRLFVETFELVRGHFQHLFRKAFGGGDGDIVLEDPNDVLECGIELIARPPGKDLKSISLMSGGEKALTAFALLLALFKTRPSPYCLLDEVDAPLDEANVGRLGALVEEFKGETQFIIITHKKPTMTISDVIYGVTMEQSGVSKRMSVRFDDVSDDGEFNTDGEDDMAQAA
ncbi:chromosome segregation protein SMC [Thalassoroseus pseudoceratinae]|uniref:chromosome segregation protein SMC n=1 Tax=Thalassoroseus pseudoceratinae TaxID=2713176 RepID=UPI001421DBC5|nr:chromosome segregation protein SMC [Thalassoroseus pseudoceratinae]